MRRRLRRRSRSGILRWSRYYYFNSLGYILLEFGIQVGELDFVWYYMYYINEKFCSDLSLVSYTYY